MKYIGTILIMTLAFVFLPWWGTYILAAATLFFMPGFVALFFTILIDFYALPQEIPFASLSFLALMSVAHVIRARMFDGVI